MRVLLLNSGGLDSAMVAKYLDTQRTPEHQLEILSVYINTNSENKNSTMAAAQETATRYCDEHKVFSLDFGETSSFTDPYGYFHSLAMVSLVTSSIAMSYCRMKNILEMYIGSSHKLVDERIEFLNQAAKGIDYMFPIPHLNAPVSIANTYIEASSILGVSLDDLSYTHSCHHEIPCGVCPKCVERATLWQT